MVRSAAFDPITFLLGRRFDLNSGGGAGLPPPPKASPEEMERRKEARAARLREVEAYRRELEQKSPEELEVLVAAERAADEAWWAQQAQEEEARRPFNRPCAMATEATYDHWTKAAYWSIDEAVALVLRRDPAKVTCKAVEPFVGRSALARQFADLRDLARRATVAKQLGLRNVPTFFLAWAGRNRIEVPAKLDAAVRAHGNQVADWKTVYDEQTRRVAELKKQIAELKSGRPSSTTPVVPKDKLGTRERESLLKLVIGMAVAGYRYDPLRARNDATAEIAGDLDTLGVSLDVDTVRKYLKEAAELLPPREAE